jgi:hypothetical protein
VVEPVFESVADNQLTIPARPTARMCKKKREKLAVSINNKLMHPVISLICRRLRTVHGTVVNMLRSMEFKSLKFKSFTD